MSKLMETVKMAMQNMKSNKARAFLTMLGIIIGIASVIMVVAVGKGATSSMSSELDGIGTGLVEVFVSQGASERITEEDIEAIEHDVKGMEGVSVLNNAVGETQTGKGDFAINITGTTEHGEFLKSSNMKYGSYFQEEDIAEGKNVCVLGESDAVRLFGSSNVIGVELDVNANGMNKVYEVIGIRAEEDSMLTFFYDEEPVTLNVPYSSMADYMAKYNQFLNIFLKIDETMDTKNVSQRVTNLLSIRHDTIGEEFFRVRNYESYTENINNTLGIMTVFVTCVAAVALLVGGIGVMNIMMVSVTERTREIGIRKSLGAKTVSILIQFLSEAAMLTVIGGIIGIVIGLLGAYGLCSLISLYMKMEIEPVIQLSMIIFATIFSCMVGVFFGLYPAKKAANLNPIEALRKLQ